MAFHQPQVEWPSTSHNALSKNIDKVVCTPPLEIPVIVDSDIRYNKRFNLVATINHTGNLRQGHYTAYIKNASTTWLHCNDSAVLPTSKSMLDNTSSYLLFFEAGWECEGREFIEGRGSSREGLVHWGQGVVGKWILSARVKGVRLGLFRVCAQGWDGCH